MTINFNLNELKQFNGSERSFKHVLNRKIIYTEGIQYLLEKARCYWLLDDIALVVFPRLLQHHKDCFYSIQFEVHADNSAVITVDDGNGNIHLQHKIKCTDFPVTENPVKFFLCEAGEHYCLMLPSEY